MKRDVIMSKQENGDIILTMTESAEEEKQREKPQDIKIPDGYQLISTLKVGYLLADGQGTEYFWLPL